MTAAIAVVGIDPSAGEEVADPIAAEVAAGPIVEDVDAAPNVEGPADADPIAEVADSNPDVVVANLAVTDPILDCIAGAAVASLAADSCHHVASPPDQLCC